MYKAVLKNELLGTTIDNMTSSILQPRKVTSVFQHQGPSPFKMIDENSMYSNLLSSNHNNSYAHHSPYSLSPLSAQSQKLLRSPRKPMRKIPKVNSLNFSI